MKKNTEYSEKDLDGKLEKKNIQGGVMYIHI